MKTGGSDSTYRSEPAIRAVDLTKTYSSTSTHVHALRNVSLQVERGEKIALLGRSGSGKSTLLNILGGLDSPTSGSLFMAGKDLAKLSTNALADYRLSAVGMIFQSFNLIPSRMNDENIDVKGNPNPEKRARMQSSSEPDPGVEARVETI